MALQTLRVTRHPGPQELVYFLCEVCVEERNIALCSDPEDMPYAPTMHPPHMSKQ